MKEYTVKVRYDDGQVSTYTFHSISFACAVRKTAAHRKIHGGELVYVGEAPVVEEIEEEQAPLPDHPELPLLMTEPVTPSHGITLIHTPGFLKAA